MEERTGSCERRKSKRRAKLGTFDRNSDILTVSKNIFEYWTNICVGLKTIGLAFDIQ